MKGTNSLSGLIDNRIRVGNRLPESDPITRLPHQSIIPCIANQIWGPLIPNLGASQCRHLIRDLNTIDKTPNQSSPPLFSVPLYSAKLIWFPTYIYYTQMYKSRTRRFHPIPFPPSSSSPSLLLLLLLLLVLL